MAKPKTASGGERRTATVRKPPNRAHSSRVARKDDSLATFDIANPKLPDDIDERAFRSGNYPYEKKYKRKAYDRELGPLQIELLKLQNAIRETGERIVIVFEGRDAAGKGGAISRFTQHLNPRSARVVALSKPTDVETGQWYFQRYVAHLPTRGEIVMFDRSWYNRGVVEPVMGFCTPEQTSAFLTEVPRFEKMLADDGIRLFKIWLHVGREMQLKRLHARMHDPLKRWKLSPIDFQAIGKWDVFSEAIDRMMTASHSDRAPWTVILSNDKLRTRLNALRLVLSRIAYKDRDESVIGTPDPAILLDGAEFQRRGGEA
jgi:polyphosphate kinase 2